MHRPPQLFSVHAVFKHIQDLATIQSALYEHAIVLLLDHDQYLLHKLYFSDQQRDRLVLSSRLIFKAALQCSATNFILVHNHPSGKVSPSKEDHYTTEKLCLVGRYLEINLIDHIIVVPNDYFSFCEEGILSGYLRP